MRQTLSTLTCLEAENIIHRDVKPDNILREYNENNQYRFRLGDFGLSHDMRVAQTFAGTEPFVAPDIYFKWNIPQSTKVVIRPLAHLFG